MAHAPPVVRLALAYAAGVASGLVGAPWWIAPLALAVFLVAPQGASPRPATGIVWMVALVVGWVGAELTAPPAACAPPGATGHQATLEGRFLASPRAGSAPFRRSEGCGDVTVVSADPEVRAGRPVRVVGSWREGRVRPWFHATEVAPGAAGEREWRWRSVLWRDALVERLGRLYGDRAPLVAALTLARREGLDPELSDRFARAGIAHLLAISGFHVGVLAGGALALLALLGVGARLRELGAAGAACAYVAFIGAPDAAARAAIMLTLVVASRARGGPPARWGPLGGALLLLLAVDPRSLAGVGFQLSFAGVAGLVAWTGPCAGFLMRASRRLLPRAAVDAVAAGVAATVATLPVVAWHFERVSLVGIPATLLATPLVALALGGALATLLLDFAWPASAAFLAGGVGVLLDGVETTATVAASWPWASVWTTPQSVGAGIAGVVLAALVARQPRVGARARRVLVAVYAATGILAWPLLLGWQGRGTLEVVVIDVGQGDAVAVRTPRGRWLLVDAGPPVRDLDPGAHPVVRALRARGVRRVEALVLTHADLDHIGGATAVLRSLPVGAVYDPGLAAPKEDLVRVLATAAERGVPWRVARAGERLAIDGITIDVLHPPATLPAGVETNAASLVALLSFGAFDLLLTGDAYTDAERTIASGLPDIEVLKVGHHDSDTSTDSLLLASARPELAVVSVGRGNRYGHPSPVVLSRLERSGASVRRTDRDGTLTVLARDDGRYEVRAERALGSDAGR